MRQWFFFTSEITFAVRRRPPPAAAHRYTLLAALGRSEAFAMILAANASRSRAPPPPLRPTPPPPAAAAQAAAGAPAAAAAETPKPRRYAAATESEHLRDRAWVRTRLTPVRGLVVPAAAASWFSFDRINVLEKRMLPEFFASA